MSRRHVALGAVGLLGVAGLAQTFDAGAAGADAVSGAAPSSSEPARSAGNQSWEPADIAWTDDTGGAGLEQGTLEVPVDYANPSVGLFRIHLARRAANDPSLRVGTLVINPGGPGHGGTDFVGYSDQVFTDEVLDAFDIVGFDPRGTGLSEPAIDCVDDYDHFYAGTDITPDDDAERQQLVDLAEEFAEACATNNAEIIQFVGTNDAARDLDSIRRALGEQEISYFGFGYGSELGAAWATLFPSTVRAAVFDSAPDPNADALQEALRQSESFEATLTTYLAQCSADPACLFHNDGDAETAFDELMVELDASPIPSTPGRPEITRGVASSAVVQAMYGDEAWPELSRALRSAQRGSGAGLLALYDAYFGYNGDGTWGNQLEAFQTIVCMDSAERPTVEEDDATAPMFNEVAPRIAPHTTGAYFCTFFPSSSDPRAKITGAGVGPILLCGATVDSSAPIEGTRAMADAFEDSHLIVVDAVNSGCLFTSACADELITDYLVDLELPAAAETSCPAD